jgi:hypothetical protein
MAGKGIGNIIAQYLSMGDIARMRDDPDSGYLSAEEHIYRLGPDARDSSRHLRPTIGVRLAEGVSETYRDTPLGDFIGTDGFDNRPILPAYYPELRGYGAVDLTEPAASFPEIDVMGLYVAEALALQRKAEAGEASPEELGLLDAYNEFLRTRTGM